MHFYTYKYLKTYIHTSFKLQFYYRSVFATKSWFLNENNSEAFKAHIKYGVGLTGS